MTDKRPEPRMKFKPVSRIGREAMIRVFGREKAERLWERGPIDENNRVPVVLPEGQEVEGEDEGRPLDPIIRP